MNTVIKVGIIGFGRMGRFYLEEMKRSGRLNIAYICDVNPKSREAAREGIDPSVFFFYIKTSWFYFCIRTKV